MERGLAAQNLGVSINSLPYVLKRTSPSTYQLQRIWLQNLTCATFPSKKVQEWCNVVVLQIHECSNLKVLDLHGLSCLCHLELVKLPELESFHFTESQGDSSKGSNGTLESLQHVVLAVLTSLKRLPDFSLCTLLKPFRMSYCKELLREPPSFLGCSQLEDLNLDWNGQWWRMQEFELDTLTSLTSLHLLNVTILRFSRRLTENRPHEYDLERFSDVKLAGLDACSQLQKLSLYYLPITSLQGLEKLTKLQELTVFSKFLQDIPDVSALAELEFLSVHTTKITRLPGVERLLQLRYFYCIDCDELTTLPDLDHLENLTFVEIHGCNSLKVMPRVPALCDTVFIHQEL